MSDDTGTFFTTDATKRIASTVRTVEGNRLDMTGQATERQLRVNDQFWVSIASNLGGGGCYEVSFLKPPTADIDPTANAAAANFGSAHTPTYGKLYAQNAPEIDKSTHALSPGRPCFATVVRRQTDDTVWVSISEWEIDDCT